MRELFQYALFLLAPFAVQLAVLFATEKRLQPLRFALPALTGAAVVLVPLLCGLTAPPGWGILVVPLVIMICLLLASLAMMGWFLAGFLYYLINLTKRKASDTP